MEDKGYTTRDGGRIRSWYREYDGDKVCIVYAVPKTYDFGRTAEVEETWLFTKPEGKPPTMRKLAW